MLNEKNLNENSIGSMKEHIQKMDVLSEVYHDMSKRIYSTKKEKDIAKLKMSLVKKEMLLLTYLINKEIDKINS